MSLFQWLPERPSLLRIGSSDSKAKPQPTPAKVIWDVGVVLKASATARFVQTFAPHINVSRVCTLGETDFEPCTYQFVILFCSNSSGHDRREFGSSPPAAV